MTLSTVCALRLRAISTVSFPGAGVWHVSWTDKDDSVGWQAYYHERNRLITALLHSPFDKGGRVLLESLFLDVKHTLSMQYYTRGWPPDGAGGFAAPAPSTCTPRSRQRLPVIRADG